VLAAHGAAAAVDGLVDRFGYHCGLRQAQPIAKLLSAIFFDARGSN
jgi:hypothetical protein